MAGKKTSKSVVSRRYAVALFESAVAAKDVKAVEKDMEGLKNLLAEAPLLQKAFANPVIAKQEISAVLKDIFKKIKVSKVTEQFIEALNENTRLNILSDIASAFEAIATDARGEIKVDITSAAKLKKDDLKKVKDAVSEITGKKVQTNEIVDKDILGGLIVKMGSTMVDGSLSGKLDRMKLYLKNSEAS